MRVLFIGGTGSISTACSKLCVERGYDLWLLNRGNRLWRMPNGVGFMPTDINDIDTVKKMMGNLKWDCVVDWTVMNRDDAERDTKLFTECAKQFIYISSAGVYKAPPLGHKISEHDEVIYFSPWTYAANKRSAEAWFLHGNMQTGFPVTIVRPGHTYCEFTIPTNIIGLGYGLMERIKQGKRVIMHDDGRSLWMLTHSSDFAVGLVGLIGSKKAIGETFHITSDEALTWLEIFDIYGKTLRVKPQVEFIPSSRIYEADKDIGAGILYDKALNRVFDNSKIKRFVPEFNPKVSVSDGLRSSLKWHRQNKGKIYYSREADKAVDEILRRCTNGMEG